MCDNASQIKEYLFITPQALYDYGSESPGSTLRSDSKYYIIYSSKGATFESCIMPYKPTAFHMSHHTRPGCPKKDYQQTSICEEDAQSLNGSI